jgi:hypothetical protein
MERPYTDTIEDDSCVIREFDENIDTIELMWHRDNEHRIIEAVEPTDWLVQFDNELPISLDKPIFIPKYAWHRTIKGTGKLRVKITKL